MQGLPIGKIISTVVSEDNSTVNLQCHELTKDWKNIISMSQFIIQGVSVTIIGIFGFAGNILSVIVLLQAQYFRFELS